MADGFQGLVAEGDMAGNGQLHALFVEPVQVAGESDGHRNALRCMLFTVTCAVSLLMTLPAVTSPAEARARVAGRAR
ncbi:hypothetical protein CTZ27_28955 [Streptomyces griseocarneus]|nr:hypothetical protein CTZ27_28955 [Streptomyces griseocarneus]